jgi:hypothetical protein
VRSTVITYDARALVEPDADTVEVLVRLQLHAQRIGVTIELRDPPPALVDLLALFGLSDLLPIAQASGVEMDRKIEEWEQMRIDEEVHRRDPTV